MMNTSRITNLALVVLMACSGYVSATTSTSDKNVDFSSRCFAPYTKAAFADQEREDNETFSIATNPVLALGDPTVEGDPKCGNIAPTVSIDATTDSNGCDVDDTTDPSNVTIDCTLTDTTLNGHTTTVTGGNSVGSDVTPTFDWTVTAAAGGDPTAAPDGSIFLDCENGNDSADGSSHANRVRTTNRAEALLSGQTSKDLYLLDNTTCEDQDLRVAWSGTSGDPVIVGSYYVSGGLELVGYQTARPEINGTYETSCRSGATCPVDGSGAIPFSKWQGLIEIVGAHVTIQDLAIHESSGVGIRYYADYTASRTGFKALRNDINETYKSAIQVNKAETGMEFQIISNTVNTTAMQRLDGYESNWPPCVLADSRGNTVKGLIDSNSITDCGGEGIGILRINGLAVRNNYLADIRRPSVYMDNSSDNVVEQNELIGDGFGGSNYQTAVAVTVEPYGSGTQDAINNVVRNNLIANLDTAISAIVTRGGTQSGSTQDPAAEGYRVGIRAYGNTVLLGSTDKFWIGRNLTVNNNVEVIELKNNLFVGTSDCEMNSGTGADIDSNAFSSTPSDSDCTGTNAVIGSLDISGNSTANDSNRPAVSAYRPGGTSDAIDAGATLTAVLLEDADYLFSDFESPVPSATEWEKKNTTDYEGTARTTPDIGALEQ